MFLAEKIDRRLLLGAGVLNVANASQWCEGSNLFLPMLSQFFYSRFPGSQDPLDE